MLSLIVLHYLTLFQLSSFVVMEFIEEYVTCGYGAACLCFRMQPGLKLLMKEDVKIMYHQLVKRCLSC